MKKSRLLAGMAITLALAFVSVTASAVTVLQMGMSDLVGNADKVFRGTVMTREPGTVAVGSGQLNTTVYTIHVDDEIKGNFGDKPVVTITMLGNMKAGNQTVNGQVRLTNLQLNPELSVGGQYVLFTSAPSVLGLSSTIGLGQGLFRVTSNAAGQDTVANELNNQHLFDGPVSYSELKAAVHAELD